jgi:hypothetical protein
MLYIPRIFKYFYFTSNINIQRRFLLQKALNDKTWMLLGPRYSRMGVGTACMASTLKGQAFVNKECGKGGGFNGYA